MMIELLTDYKTRSQKKNWLQNKKRDILLATVTIKAINMNNSKKYAKASISEGLIQVALRINILKLRKAQSRIFFLQIIINCL